MSPFYKLVSFLTKKCIEQDKFVEYLESLGISHKSWPEDSEGRTYMEKLIAYSQEGGAEYARNRLFDEGAIASINLLCAGYEAPLDRAPLQLRYNELLEDYKLSWLKNQINSVSSLKELAALNDQINSGTESSNAVVSFGDYVDEVYLNEKTRIAMTGEEHVRVPNWPMMSKMIGGFNPARLGIFIADSGFGKTNFAVQFALDAAIDMSVLYFNMEMSGYDFTHRAMACVNQLTYTQMHTADFSGPQALLKARGRRFFYSLGKDLTLYEIGAISRRYKAKEGIKIIVVDYDQKLVLNGKDEEWKELQRAAVWLEGLAKELGVYILLLAQSNHNQGISGSKRSIFPASNVSLFYDDGEHGPCIRMLKNRFGKRSACLSVDYQPESCTVRENNYVNWKDKINV